MVGSRSPSPTADATGAQALRGPTDQNADANPAHGTSNLDSGLLRQDDSGAISSRGDAPAGRPRSSEEGRTRVRLSEDSGSRIRNNNLGSDEISPVTRSRDTQSAGLKLDTGSTDNIAHGVTNTGSSSGGQSPPAGVTPNVSPQMNPRGRTRGMSLRSSLFAKNIGQQRAQDVDDAIIEMGEVISPIADEDKRPETAKSKGEASITVSPVARGSSLSPEVSQLEYARQTSNRKPGSHTRQPWNHARIIRLMPVQYSKRPWSEPGNLCCVYRIFHPRKTVATYHWIQQGRSLSSTTAPRNSTSATPSALPSTTRGISCLGNSSLSSQSWPTFISFVSVYFR